MNALSRVVEASEREHGSVTTLNPQEGGKIVKEARKIPSNATISFVDVSK